MADERLNNPIELVEAEEGEMESLISLKDWSKHPLGVAEKWPILLKSFIGTILGSRFPMLLYWGEDLHCFYNDAFRPSLGQEGKHPAILGMPAKQAWTETWPTIGPLIGQVLAGGESIWMEDALVPIYRNGSMEDVHWTFSYSAVRGESNNIEGVLVTCMETTGKLKALARTHASEARVQAIVQQVPVAMALLKGPEHVVEIVNERALEIWGRQRDDVENRPILEVMPELKEQGFGKFLTDALRGKPFHASELPVVILRNNELVTQYLNFTYEPLVDDEGRPDGVMAVGTDVTETVLAKQRAEAGEARFRLLADSMPQFVWTGNVEGELNYFNKSIGEYSGVPVTELHSEGWLSIVHPDDREENIRLWTEAITTGTDFLFEHRFRRKDGGYRWQLSRGKPLRDKEGKIHLWVGTSTDIQDIKEQDQEKNFLIGMAGHEMRNPLSTLRSCVDLLNFEMAESMDVEQRHIVQMMERQVDKLTRMLSDLVDVSTLKKGSLELDLSRFDVADMVRTAVDEMRRNHPNRAFNSEANVKALVHADRYRINQVLGNLLGNAVKYSPNGMDVDISCEVNLSDVRVAIRDQGVGISKAEQELIFQRFYRVQKSDDGPPVEGFGIGLYLVADIIRRHNGQLTVESEEGKGSLFTFTLPLAV